MMHFSKALKTAALAGLFGLGVVGATSAPAMAHRVYTRCDSDGDRCWRVVCDDDGDRCTRQSMNTGYYGYRNYYNNGYYNGRYYDRDRSYYNNGYYSSGRHWVCDSDGDRCHWSYSEW